MRQAGPVPSSTFRGARRPLLFLLALGAAATFAAGHGGTYPPPPPPPPPPTHLPPTSMTPGSGSASGGSGSAPGGYAGGNGAGTPAKPPPPPQHNAPPPQTFTGHGGQPHSGHPGATQGPTNPATAGAAAPLAVGGGVQHGSQASTGVDPSTLDTTDEWQLWWNDHQEQFLQLRQRLAPGRQASPVGQLTGRGRVDHGSGRRAADAEVEQQVVPLLLELLSADDKPEVLDSALIALGRCANEADADEVLGVVRPQLASKYPSVQTSAVLALGIHGSPRFVPLLGAILADGPAGRQAVGGPVPPLVRSLAALALGLANHPGAVPQLTDLLGSLPDSQLELKSCAITALGSTGNVAANDATAELVGLLRDRRLDSPLKAQVPLALARLDDGTREETVPALLLAFSDRDQDDRVRASIAQALGRLAETRQAPVLDALILAAHKEHHVATRHAALIALAEIGLRDAPDEAQHPDVHERLAACFKELLQDPPSYTDRPWTALATGIYARGQTPAAGGLRSALLEEYRSQKDPSVRGAGALALGLCGDIDAADLLLADFRAAGDPLLRGYAALALGLIGVRSATPEMLAMCSDKATDPVVREQVALGLALLRDPDVVPTLLDVLGRVQTHNVSLPVARVLGRIGDESAIPELAGIARDKARPDSTRGMAVVALGLLGERGDLPWNASLRALRNDETPVAALQLVFDIL